ncbi:hypothetical protein OG948_26385 [Embleya sp. NBC_00888]|uniref:hypothetical protein n=1 Tax=Embleya sp. NBC_00888 TaxID=2975960 RepID=UPI0038635ED3|nr:hypothetical protein OG948_26385 [Embleya sp. NBC_00888]
MYLRKPAVPGLLIAASVIALSSGCGLVDKVKGDDDKKKDPAAAAPQAGGGSTGGASGAPATQPGGGKGTAPATAPETGKPGAGTVDVGAKDFCNLLTPAELKGVLGSEVPRTKNDPTLHSCRYYGPGDSSLLTVQYFTQSSRLSGTAESVAAKNDASKYGKPITDLGAFPTLYVAGDGAYPAPSVPEVYFVKPRGTDLMVEAHVSLAPAAKGLPRTQHIAIAKIVADKI